MLSWRRQEATSEADARFGIYSQSVSNRPMVAFASSRAENQAWLAGVDFCISMAATASMIVLIAVRR
jgi:hypothetical protein